MLYVSKQLIKKKQSISLALQHATGTFELLAFIWRYGNTFDLLKCLTVNRILEWPEYCHAAKSDMAVDVENFGLAEVEHNIIGPTVFL